MLRTATRVRECGLKFQGPNSMHLRSSDRHESQGVWSDVPWTKQHTSACFEPPLESGSVVGCSRDQRQNTLLPASTDYDTHTRNVTLSENSSASNNRWYHEQHHSARDAGVCMCGRKGGGGSSTWKVDQTPRKASPWYHTTTFSWVTDVFRNVTGG